MYVYAQLDCSLGKNTDLGMGSWGSIPSQGMADIQLDNLGKVIKVPPTSVPSEYRLEDMNAAL